MNAFFYFSIIILWGLTWFAIKNQIGIVPIQISLIYRFALAALIIFIIMLIKRQPFKFTLKQHGAMALLGILLFSTNFIFLYSAAAYITSGLIAIVFSTSVIMVMLNSLIFMQKRVTLKMFVGALLGLIGLCCIFSTELKGLNLSDKTFYGLILALIGTYCFSWANQVSTFCSRLKIPLISSTFYGMIYGVILLNIYCLVQHISFSIDLSFKYIASLAYLVIPGSVIGFLTYLGLVKRLGPEKAVYSTLFFPLVALLVSTYFEAFVWDITHFIGVALIIIGNALVLWKPTANKITS